MKKYTVFHGFHHPSTRLSSLHRLGFACSPACQTCHFLRYDPEEFEEFNSPVKGNLESLISQVWKQMKEVSFSLKPQKSNSNPDGMYPRRSGFGQNSNNNKRKRKRRDRRTFA